ncbi:hypothetical protein K488DRAFT_90731 [Vararia minispora EC-137]|uniref:Uncharacterized protein n=1 Tax=Vararia minispora EC-137 TaxID=1314806 RepID=A0ACB8Q7D4_9AGAM|nr:hypothetical protein K488DRAFT_90731 [Vararia minispora EC-137]
MATLSTSCDDSFFFSGNTYGSNDVESCFYVRILEDGGKRHHHTRASPLTLHSLLTWTNPGPVLTKKGVPSKRQPAPHKDEPWHFYTAQLLHYGLKPLKTKAAAKKALLAAFGGGTTLQVPQHILTLQQKLRAEWLVVHAKVKVQHEEERATKERALAEQRLEARWKHAQIVADSDEEHSEVHVKPGASKKRKPEAPATTTAPAKKAKPTGKFTSLDTCGKYEIFAPRLSDEYGDVGFVLELSPSTRVKHIWGSFHFGVVMGILRCDALPTTAGEPCSFKWRGEETDEGQMYFGDNTGTLTFLGGGAIRGVFSGPVFGESTKFSGQQDPDLTRRVMWSKSIRGWKDRWRGYNSRSCNAAAARRWGQWHPDRDFKERAADSDTTLDLLDTRGDFVVTAPELGRQWDVASGELTLKLSPSSTGRHLWGRFDFGIVSGVLRCDVLPTTVNSSCIFTWRGTESGENEMTFSDFNTGTITFHGGGHISGTIAADLFQSVEFTGAQSQKTWLKQVKAWKGEWRSINERTYHAASIARWGKWSEELDHKEPPAESDTSDGEGSDDESRKSWDEQGSHEYADEDAFAFAR